MALDRGAAAGSVVGVVRRGRAFLRAGWSGATSRRPNRARRVFPSPVRPTASAPVWARLRPPPRARAGSVHRIDCVSVRVSSTPACYRRRRSLRRVIDECERERRDSEEDDQRSTAASRRAMSRRIGRPERPGNGRVAGAPLPHATQRSEAGAPRERPGRGLPATGSAERSTNGDELGEAGWSERRPSSLWVASPRTNPSGIVTPEDDVGMCAPRSRFAARACSSTTRCGARDATMVRASRP